MTTKICSICGKEKNINEFSFRKDRNKHRTDCKECRCVYGRNYRKENIEKIKEHKNNPIVKERDRRLNKEWRTNNKDKLRANLRRQYKQKYRNNPQYRIRRLLSIRIIKVLKGTNKSKNTLELLGCTLEYLQEYFKSKFTEGMTWELFMEGKIHIDHIRPCASFDLTDPEQQKHCFHYTNLQPLWALDNIKKSNKYEE